MIYFNIFVRKFHCPYVTKSMPTFVYVVFFFLIDSKLVLHERLLDTNEIQIQIQCQRTLVVTDRFPTRMRLISFHSVVWIQWKCNPVQLYWEFLWHAMWPKSTKRCVIVRTRLQPLMFYLQYTVLSTYDFTSAWIETVCNMFPKIDITFVFFSLFCSFVRSFPKCRFQ